MKTPAQRKQDERARMRELGFVLRQVWVHPDEWEPIRRQVERAIEARKLDADEQRAREINSFLDGLAHHRASR